MEREKARASASKGSEHHSPYNVIENLYSTLLYHIISYNTIYHLPKTWSPILTKRATQKSTHATIPATSLHLPTSQTPLFPHRHSPAEKKLNHHTKPIGEIRAFSTFALLCSALLWPYSALLPPQPTPRHSQPVHNNKARPKGRIRSKGARIFRLATTG